MTLSVPLLLKGLLAAVAVGFVTASIKSWVDRVFLVIMLVGILGLPIREAIIVNLVVLSLAALLMVIRKREMFLPSGPIGIREWLLIVIPAIMGGIVGRFAAGVLSPGLLLGILGVYAVFVGLRIFLIKPFSERETKTHHAWLAPAGLGSGFFAGLISAGGKPFSVPLYNNAMGHHPQRAYAFATLGVIAAAWSALATQAAFFSVPSGSDMVLSFYEFVLITVTALIVEKFWTAKLNRIVNLTIAPLLILVGLKFFISALM